MKILLLPAYYYPEKVAGAHLSEHKNLAFANAGFYMEAYLPTPCRGISNEIRVKYKKQQRYTLYDGKLEIRYFSMFAEGRNPILRALRYSLCWLMQLWYGLNAKNIDCIYLSSTPPIQGLLGVVLKKIKKVPFIYNLQDIFPDSLIGTGLARQGGLLWKIGRAIENCTYRNADKIIVISEDFKCNIIDKGVPEHKIEIVYNWVDQNAVKPIAKSDNRLLQELKINPDIFTIVYAGNLGNAQNIDVIIEAAKILTNENVQFIIFGTGGMKECYIEKANRYKLSNIRFFPLQPAERISEVYGLGDLCIVSCKAGLGKSAMPSKTLSILSSGIPVLASFDKGELTDMLETNKCGIVVEAGNAVDFANAIKIWHNRKEECMEMGNNGRKLVLSQFTREVGTQKYVDIIKNIVMLNTKLK